MQVTQNMLHLCINCILQTHASHLQTTQRNSIQRSDDSQDKINKDNKSAITHTDVLLDGRRTADVSQLPVNNQTKPTPARSHAACD